MDIVTKSTRKPPTRRGSRKGIPNKVTADIKSMVLGALSAMGGQRYLEEQAEANATAFMGLLGKILPTQITGAGAGGEHVVITKIELVALK